MSATAPIPPARRSRPTHGPRAIIAAVVAGAVTLAAVIGVGWIASATLFMLILVKGIPK